MRLDIGCGEHKPEGWAGLDRRDDVGAEFVWDVNVHPWPIEDNSVEAARASHLIEHIPPVMVGPQGTWFPFVAFMDEVWRILQPLGEFEVSYPHGSSQGYIQDPTHCNPVNETTWAYFDPAHPFYTFYKPRPWAAQSMTWEGRGFQRVVLVKMAEGAE